jgi:hypothetical protein
VQGCANVTLSGARSAAANSTLKMRRDDYAVPSRGTCPSCKLYKKAEWRCGIWLEGATVRAAQGV